MSPPALAVPLLNSEILSETLFQRNVYLESNGTASGSQGEKTFSALRSSRATDEFIASISNRKKLPLQSSYFYPSGPKPLGLWQFGFVVPYTGSYVLLRSGRKPLLLYLTTEKVESMRERPGQGLERSRLFWTYLCHELTY